MKKSVKKRSKILVKKEIEKAAENIDRKMDKKWVKISIQNKGERIG